MSGARRRRRLQRLAEMNAGEVAFRARMRGRHAATRLLSLWRPPTWHRVSLAGALDVRFAPALTGARASLDASDWIGAHRELSQYFHDRPRRFVIAPAQRRQIASAIHTAFPLAAASAAGLADRIVSGRYDLLGYRNLRFTDERQDEEDRPVDPEWHLDPVHHRRAPLEPAWRIQYLDPSYGDHKIIWELNRHQHWMTLGRAAWLTGDTKYRSAFLGQLQSWMSRNPPLTGINWASMLEIALRSISWIWALHFFAGDEEGHDAPTPWLVDLLLGIDRQLTAVERNLSYYFSPNTHLTGEALGLYVAGRTLPELRRAARWEATGRRILIDEISRQISADGGHVEQSTHYHRYTLDFYLLALSIARATGDEAALPLAEAVGRLAQFTRMMADDSGRLAPIGDEDSGSLFPLCGRDPADVRDSLALAAWLVDRPDLAIAGPPEELIWMTNGEWHPRPDRAGAGVSPPRWAADRSAALETSGYFVSHRDGHHLVFDAGPHGYQNAGHAHADALSVTLALGGRPLLIDPGTGTYTMDRTLRDRFRSTALHNTLTLDGRSQSVPDGPFHWASMAAAEAHRLVASPGFDYVDASHAGYAPVFHRRALIIARPNTFLIADSLIGSGHHQAGVHWHLDPEWALERPQDGPIRITHPDGPSVWFVTTARVVRALTGDMETGLGWHAPQYGRIMANTTLEASIDDPLPCSLVTLIARATADESVAPQITRLTVSGGGAADSWNIGLRIRRQSSIDVALFTFAGGPTMDASAGDAGATRRVADLETDARALFCRRHTDGSLREVSSVDGTFVRWSGDARPAVQFERTVGDVTVAFGADSLIVSSSSDLPAMSVRWQRSRPPANVLINGARAPVSLREGFVEVPASSKTDATVLEVGA